MTSDAGDSLRQAKAIDISSRTRTYRNRVGGSDPNDFFRFRLNQRSSLDLQLGRLRHNADMELIRDANGNSQIDPGDRLASSKAPGRTPERIVSDRLERGTYYIRVFSQESRRRSYRLSLSAKPSSAPLPSGNISAGSWSAQFLDRTPDNVTDYGSYDFSQSGAVRDLGLQGRQGSTIARLALDYGDGSPAGVQPDHFAMQAWTRIDLQAGKLYQLTSDSDDGTRFLFKDRQTGATLTELNGSWQHRNLQAPAWTQLLNVSQSGQYDFYVQYYDKIGKAKVGITLEEVAPTGQVVASQLNLRSQPSTQNNLPIASLNFGDRFTVVQKVQSADPYNPEWYEVVTSNNQRGFVAADRSFVDVGSGAMTIGAQKTDTVPPIGGGGSSFPLSGKISRKVLLNSDQQIAFRSGKDTSFGLIDRLTVNTPLTVLEKVAGGRYGNGFDEWYRVRVNQGGQEREGYVAAYYVDVNTSDGKYQTAISRTNSLYAPHLSEATNPRYYPSSYKPMIEAAAAQYAWLQPSVIAGIGSRESAWGLVLSTPGPTGTGDGGHGRGLMQIDDRYHQEFIRSGKWRDPKESILYAVDRVLRPNYDYLDRNTNLQGTELLRGAIAAYNAGLTNVMNAIGQGRDVDYYTTGRDYSWDVLNRAGWFQLNGWA